MADQNNFYQINGVIFAKPIRTVQGKKDPTQTYDFASIILEVKSEYKGTTYHDFPEFELGKGVNVDDFKIGDYVDIYFSTAGKKLSEKFHKTTLRAKYIKHADIQSGLTDIGGKTPQEIRKEKEVFVVPNPYDGKDGPDDSEMPF